LRISLFTSVKDLNTKVRAFIDAWNDRAHPFVWTKTAVQLLEYRPTVLASPHGTTERLTTSAWSWSCSMRTCPSSNYKTLFATVGVAGSSTFLRLDGVGLRVPSIPCVGARKLATALGSGPRMHVATTRPFDSSSPP
jgi:hypothetical protein